MERNWLVGSEFYVDCPAGMQWKSIMYAAICLDKNPSINPEVIETFPNLNLPPAFTFLFDGFNAYDPDSAYGLAANVHGNETFFRSRLRDNDLQRYRANQATTAINAYNATFNNIRFLGTTLMDNRLNNDLSKYNKENEIKLVSTRKNFFLFSYNHIYHCGMSYLQTIHSCI